MNKSYFSSPLGTIQLTYTSNSLIGLQFINNPFPLKEEHSSSSPILQETLKWLTLYFRGESPSFIPHLSLEGSEFQLLVWRTIASIPYGRTISYYHLSQQIARQRNLSKLSPQAIGKALSKNPILIIIPCHRIIGKNGELIGYAGGLEKKKELLHIERVRTQGFFDFN